MYLQNGRSQVRHFQDKTEYVTLKPLRPQLNISWTTLITYAMYWLSNVMIFIELIILTYCTRTYCHLMWHNPTINLTKSCLRNRLLFHHKMQDYNTHCTRETNLVEDGDLRDAGAGAAQCVEPCVFAEHGARVGTVAAVHDVTVAARYALDGVGRMSQHLERLQLLRVARHGR